MNKTTASKIQRIGTLIEEHVCKEHGLTPNKRSSRAYYDAYNAEQIFEIKAASKRNNRVTVQITNHKQLLETDSSYIVVLYDLVNSDKELCLITDIKILDIIIVKSNVMNDILIKYGVGYNRDYKGRMKQYSRIRFDNIKEYIDMR